MRHCKCGNTLSLQRQEDGIDNCPACDPSQDQIDIEDIIDGIEFDLSFTELNNTVVMNRLLELAQFIHTHLVETK